MMNSTSRSLIVILFVPESACMGSLFIADTPINITKMVNCITLSRRERELKRSIIHMIMASIIKRSKRTKF
jgi:hypothetical protein